MTSKTEKQEIIKEKQKSKTERKHAFDQESKI